MCALCLDVTLAPLLRRSRTTNPREFPQALPLRLKHQNLNQPPTVVERTMALAIEYLDLLRRRRLRKQSKPTTMTDHSPRTASSKMREGWRRRKRRRTNSTANSKTNPRYSLGCYRGIQAVSAIVLPLTGCSPSPPKEGELESLVCAARAIRNMW